MIYQKTMSPVSYTHLCVDLQTRFYRKLLNGKLYLPTRDVPAIKFSAYQGSEKEFFSSYREVIRIFTEPPPFLESVNYEPETQPSPILPSRVSLCANGENSPTCALNVDNVEYFPDIFSDPTVSPDSLSSQPNVFYYNDSVAPELREPPWRSIKYYDFDRNAYYTQLSKIQNSDSRIAFLSGINFDQILDEDLYLPANWQNSENTFSHPGELSEFLKISNENSATSVNDIKDLERTLDNLFIYIDGSLAMNKYKATLVYGEIYWYKEEDGSILDLSLIHILSVINELVLSGSLNIFYYALDTRINEWYLLSINKYPTNLSNGMKIKIRLTTNRNIEFDKRVLGLYRGNMEQFSLEVGSPDIPSLVLTDLIEVPGNTFIVKLSSILPSGISFNEKNPTLLNESNVLLFFTQDEEGKKTFNEEGNWIFRKLLASGADKYSTKFFFNDPIQGKLLLGTNYQWADLRSGDEISFDWEVKKNSSGDYENSAFKFEGGVAIRTLSSEKYIYSDSDFFENKIVKNWVTKVFGTERYIPNQEYFRSNLLSYLTPIFNVERNGINKAYTYSDLVNSSEDRVIANDVVRIDYIPTDGTFQYLIKEESVNFKIINLISLIRPSWYGRDDYLLPVGGYEGTGYVLLPEMNVTSGYKYRFVITYLLDGRKETFENSSPSNLSNGDIVEAQLYYDETIYELVGVEAIDLTRTFTIKGLLPYVPEVSSTAMITIIALAVIVLIFAAVASVTVVTKIRGRIKAAGA